MNKNKVAKYPISDFLRSFAFHHGSEKSKVTRHAHNKSFTYYHLDIKFDSHYNLSYHRYKEHLDKLMESEETLGQPYVRMPQAIIDYTGLGDCEPFSHGRVIRTWSSRDKSEYLITILLLHYRDFMALLEQQGIESTPDDWAA